MSQVVGKQSLGKREAQEDAFRLVLQDEEDPTSDILMILADGMGGHAGGETASNLAVDSFAQHFVHDAVERRPRARLEASLQRANDAVSNAVSLEPSLRGMGCTLVGALRKGNRFSWVSVGDSHVYLFRENRLKKLNADHSLYGELLELIEAGTMTAQEAANHPRRNALRSAVMGSEIALIDIDAITLQNEDLVVLASDGLDTLSQAEIVNLLGRDKRPDVRALGSDLLNAVEAKESRTQDNTTVIVYRHISSKWSSINRFTQLGDLQAENSYRKLMFAVAFGLIVAALLVFSVWMQNGRSPVDVPAEVVSPEAEEPPTPRKILDPSTTEDQRIDEEEQDATPIQDQSRDQPFPLDDAAPEEGGADYPSTEPDPGQTLPESET